MASYEFVTVDVFTDQRFGGNPLAVFPDARGLSDAQMQALAREFNLSETTFVLPPDNPQNTARVRIFTPAHEMPFAGHPNVGTGYVLATRASHLPEHFTFEEIAGLVRVHIQHDAAGAIIGTRIAAPRSLQIDIDVPAATVAGLVGLSEADIVTTAHTPLVATMGVPFVFAQLTGLDVLARAQPDLAAFRRAALDIPELDGRLSLLLYALRDGQATRPRTRMFAPLGGILEDPATGSANVTLAALLTSLAPGDNVELAFDIEQGIEMGRPSRLYATAQKTGEGPVSASIAGNCVPVLRGTVEL
jgi:trans-2,3-dihydro-3-hydroxyanthranilate isomerase